jgi:hypothetical protein
MRFLDLDEKFFEQDGKVAQGNMSILKRQKKVNFLSEKYRSIHGNEGNSSIGNRTISFRNCMRVPDQVVSFIKHLFLDPF